MSGIDITSPEAVWAGLNTKQAMMTAEEAKAVAAVRAGEDAVYAAELYGTTASHIEWLMS